MSDKADHLCAGGRRLREPRPHPRREIYLSSIPLEEALAIWRSACERLHVGSFLSAETVATEEALGRVTFGPVFAASSSPHYHAAAMDGIAVRAADTAHASQASPRRLRVGPEAIYVNTGDPLPDDSDAVIMIEDVAEIEPGVLEIVAAAAPWQHTRVIGEDVVATDVVVPARQRLGPADIGALLAAGVTELAVVRPPRVAIIPTGAEIVRPGEASKPGEIPDFNSPMIAARLSELGALTTRRSPVGDDAAAIQRAVESACEQHDLVLTLAGASAGARDFTAEAIRAAGELLVHGVAIRPGKPVALGLVGGSSATRPGSKPVIALPGYPVSAMLCCDLFVIPTLCMMLGVPTPQRPRVTATVSRKVASVAGSREYVRVHMGEVDGRVVAVPSGRGAGLVSSLARADGLLIIPALSEGVLKGAEGECELLRPEHEIRNTILITGSHDVALDLLASEMRSRAPELSVTSTHVGSMAGLAALRERFCHAAGTHLLDPDTGEYNWRYVRELFGDPGSARFSLPESGDVLLVTVAHRQQGFIVRPGNPKGIQSWHDLAREDVTFVNRQAGAGTRVLLDSELAKAGIEPRSVNGYRREVYTHLAVASMVETGVADVGLGILAAARARELDFVPVAMERYDLAVRPQTWKSPLGRALKTALESDQFRSELMALGGYDDRETGVVQQPPAQ
jgi:putative molybdopterin biosynthesis protein